MNNIMFDRSSLQGIIDGTYKSFKSVNNTQAPNVKIAIINTPDGHQAFHIYNKTETLDKYLDEAPIQKIFQAAEAAIESAKTIREVQFINNFIQGYQNVHSKTVTNKIQEWADVNSAKHLDACACKKTLQIHQLDIDKKKKVDALHLSIMKDSFENFKKVLRSNLGLLTERNNSRETILHIAARRGDRRFMEELLRVSKEFLSSEEFEKIINGSDNAGRTPLHIAFLSHIPHRNECVTLLIDAGSALGMSDRHEQTPLAIADQRGLLDILSEYFHQKLLQEERSDNKEEIKNILSFIQDLFKECPNLKKAKIQISIPGFLGNSQITLEDIAAASSAGSGSIVIKENRP